MASSSAQHAGHIQPSKAASRMCENGMNHTCGGGFIEIMSQVSRQAYVQDAVSMDHPC